MKAVRALQIEERKMMALWWLTSCQTGYYRRAKIFQGDKELTDEQKLRDAMETAMRHIHLMREMIENEMAEEMPQSPLPT